MRLTQILLKWPRSRPNGNIWIGKDKMVRLVKPKDLNKMEKQIALEKKNSYACLNPYISPEEERIAMAARENIGPRPDQLLFRLRKKRAEVTSMAPTFAEDNLRHLAHNVSWEK